MPVILSFTNRYPQWFVSFPIKILCALRVSLPVSHFKRFVGYVASIEKNKNANKFYQNVSSENSLVRLRQEDNIKVYLAQVEYGGVDRAQLMSIRSNGGILWTRQWTFHTHKIRVFWTRFRTIAFSKNTLNHGVNYWFRQPMWHSSNTPSFNHCGLHNAPSYEYPITFIPVLLSQKCYLSKRGKTTSGPHMAKHE